MSERNDGGSAFGHAAENGHCCGATLRDYFAAQALFGFCATLRGDDADGPIWNPEGVAHRAYALADAMLEARKSWETEAAQ